MIACHPVAGFYSGHGPGLGELASADVPPVVDSKRLSAHKAAGMSVYDLPALDIPTLPHLRFFRLIDA
jgi:hypothetical protein